MPTSGPSLTRARVGFNPTNPHAAAGTRIEPPASLPCPIATIPLATAAPDPPLEPPDDRSRSHGLRVGPYAVGSVVAESSSCGTFVRPTHTNPAARKRCAR